jgi:predicted nucleic acid-binding protein
VTLVDTSVWIATFRSLRPLRLTEEVPFDEVATCLPVVQEVLQGFREEHTFRRAREAMLALPTVESPLTAPLLLEAVALYRAARRAGITVRSSVDCLIAACAIRHDLEVLHADRDFAALARIAPLRQRNVHARAR